MSKVLITGGTGLFGQALSPLLMEKGYSLAYLSRSAQSLENIEVFIWDIKQEKMAHQALEGVECIIHLAGAGVADERWSASRKKAIIESRTQSTELLYKTLKTQSHSVKTFISASAVGYYGGNQSDLILKEEAPPGEDFLAKVTKAWEESVDQIESLGIRTLKFRIGVVLSPEGGALPKIIQPIRYGAGAALGSGKQYLSWIHIGDLARMFIYGMENEALSGVYNAVAPNPVTNKEFTRVSANVLQKPLILPNVPSFALRLMLGEMADIVLEGNRVSSQKIEAAGFKFNFPHLAPSLEDLL